MAKPTPETSQTVRADSVAVGDSIYVQHGWYDGPEDQTHLWRIVEDIHVNPATGVIRFAPEMLTGESQPLYKYHQPHSLVIVPN